MPKAVLPALPVSGLFAVAKPSGPTSMAVVNDLKTLVAGSRLFVAAATLRANAARGALRGRRLRETVKIGQGGTLDPLADGVLVIGVGKGTKRLGEFLDCVKEYRSTGVLGCETDTYDSEGARVRTAPWRHVTREKLEEALPPFRGEIAQAPPIFSALKMDGKPLYEYARKGIPLPRPIEKRNVTVHRLEVTDWLGSGHSFRWPEKKLTDEEKHAVEKALSGVEENPVVKDDAEASEDTDDVTAAFVVSMKVSGGTYVRSIVHDLAHAVGSAGHVATLTRSRQGRFALDPTEAGDVGCVPWAVFERAIKDAGAVDDDGWTEWERAVIDNLEIVTGKNEPSGAD